MTNNFPSMIHQPVWFHGMIIQYTSIFLSLYFNDNPEELIIHCCYHPSLSDFEAAF